MNQVANFIKGELSKHPRTQAELGAGGGYKVPLDLKSPIDQKQSDEYGRSGLGLLKDDYEDYTKILNRMRTWGFKLSTGSTAAEWKTYGHLQKYAEQERAHNDRLVKEGIESTAAMGKEAAKAAAGLDAAANLAPVVPPQRPQLLATNDQKLRYALEVLAYARQNRLADDKSRMSPALPDLIQAKQSLKRNTG